MPPCCFVFCAGRDWLTDIDKHTGYWEQTQLDLLLAHYGALNTILLEMKEPPALCMVDVKWAR